MPVASIMQLRWKKLPRLLFLQLCSKPSESMVHENYENLHGAALGEVVNGQKTFISGGMNADYFTTGVRTSGKTGSKALAHLHSVPG